MSFKKNTHFLLIALTTILIVVTSCKKPRNGNYTYEETGTKKTYLKEDPDPYVLSKTVDISTSEKVRVKNKKDVLKISDIVWVVNGDSATNRGNSSSVTSVNQSFKSHYSYCGVITSKKSIEGTFKRVQVIKSFNNTTIDSSSGTFKYQRD
ncbi:MAG: hypothetical protein H0W73_12415 [Bacteroidetes bacterium]|nr:hypothetical protein [Bacteroidota bacterium]